jgi:hypothetical protein
MGYTSQYQLAQSTLPLANTPREAKRFKLARYLYALRFRRQAQPFFLKSLLHRGTEPQETFPVRALRLPRKLFRDFLK